MKISKALSILLAAAVLVTLLTACKEKTGDAETDGVNADARSADIDFDAALRKFEIETVMLTAGDFTADWELTYYFICRAVEDIYASTGQMPDLSDTSETGYGEQIRTRALERIMTCLAIESAAKQKSAVITDEDRATIALNKEQAEEAEGGADAFLDYLKRSHAGYEVYLYLMEIDRLYENTLTATWGEGADSYPDADVEAFIADEDYMMVKHILFSKFEGDGETPLGASAEADKLATAETVLQALKDYSGDDFDAYFDEQMKSYSEDMSGLNMYPKGYLFTPGQAHLELEQAASGLEVGGLSDVIMTSMGYHIVYRIPVDYDVIPQGYSWSTSNTLRSQAARETFGNYVEDLRIKLAEGATGEFFELDIAELFK